MIGVSPVQNIPSFTVYSPRVAPGVFQSTSIIQSPKPEPVVQRIDQTLRVVDVRQVNEYWRLKVEKLEAELLRLRDGNPAVNTNATENKLEQQEKTIEVKDDSKITLLQREISNGMEQIKHLNTAISQLKDSNDHFMTRIQKKEKQIKDILKEIKDLKDEAEKANEMIDKLETEIETVKIESQEKHAPLHEEANEWKRKFLTLNREFHEHQEVLLLTQAELDQLKANQKAQAQVVVNRSVHTTLTTTKRVGESE